MPRIDLSSYDNSWYSPGRNKLIRALWFFVGLPIIRSSLLPFSSIRCIVLRCFGARLAQGIVLKPGIRVKYPWLLSIGNDSWIGEDVWIDNLAEVKIGAHVCISQGAYLCTGSHDWADRSFGLDVRPIALGDGSWVGARALIGPGVMIGACGIATAGSVVVKPIPAYEIHSGNPAAFARRRVLRNTESFDQILVSEPPATSSAR